MNDQTKSWIDNASYEELLSRWRYGKLGDPMFMDVTGAYYSKVMFEKNNRLTMFKHLRM